MKLALTLALISIASPNRAFAEKSCKAHWITTPTPASQERRCVLEYYENGRRLNVQNRVVAESKEACEECGCPGSKGENCY